MPNLLNPLKLCISNLNTKNTEIVVIKVLYFSKCSIYIILCTNSNVNLICPYPFLDLLGQVMFIFISTSPSKNPTNQLLLLSKLVSKDFNELKFSFE